MKKILFAGPLLPPTHGQSLAFTRFYESVENGRKLLINTNFEHLGMTGKVIGNIKVIFLTFLKIIFFKIDKVYFTCSRSFLGSFKDVILINLAALKKIKIYNHLHGSDFYEYFHSVPLWYQKILYNSYNKVDTSIVLLDSMKEQFKDFPDMNLEIVPNFYDKELDVVFEKKDLKTINLLYLSNIIKSKGIFELLESFEVLSRKYDNIYLSIGGDFLSDEYMNKDDIKHKFLEKVKNNRKINYIGKVYGEEKIELLKKSDIFVLPSYYKSEAFPISIVEAMRCGNAIVSTNYKYLPEIVDENNGILVEPKSPESLYKGIEYLLKNKTLLKNIQTRNKIEAEEKYSLNRYTEQLHKIILSEDS